MNTPYAKETQSFFLRIGYKVEQVHPKGEVYSVWKLTQPSNQGDQIFSSLSDLWKHWIPRGNEHLLDDLDFQRLMAHYQSAEPKERKEIIAAIMDYWANPFFCSPSSSNLIITLTKGLDTRLPEPLSAEWRDAIIAAIDKPHGQYGFAARAALSLGVSESM